MVIEVDSELEAALATTASASGTTPEEVALAALRARFLPKPPFVPRDDWERRLLAFGKDCGVSLPNEAFLREDWYE